MATSTGNESPTSASSYHLPNISEGGMSPHSISATLAAHPSIPEETMREIATGLLQTIDLHKATHKRHMDKSKEDHDWTIWALNEKLLHLEELIGDDDDEELTMLEGYIENKGKIPSFNIPVGEGMYLPAKWIRLHPRDYMCVQGLTGKDSAELPHSIDIYASPDLVVTEVPEPLPLWVQALIEGHTATFETFWHAAIDLNDYGLVADLTQARESYLQAQEMELTRDQIKADLLLINEWYMLMQSRLKVACISKRLTRQQCLIPLVLCDDANFPHKFPCPNKSTSPTKQGRFPV
jgi:hypothetical protein